MKNRLIIVDISSFIFRSFFAIRPLHTPKGVPVNAVYGVLGMLIKLLEEYKPTHFVLARDTKEGSLREEIYPEYKANRSAAPDDLIPQFEIIDNLVDKMRVPSIKIPRYEADDIIGSLAIQFKNDFDEILIASSDKDLMQFIDDKVKMIDTMKEKIYGVEDVKEKMGVNPDKIMDYLSIIGDTSDNIPGIKGIGPKGAQKLLDEYGNLDNIYKNLDQIANGKLKDALIAYKDKAYLSKELVKIHCDLNLQKSANDLKFELKQNQELSNFLTELGFKNLEKKFEKFKKDENEKTNLNLETIIRREETSVFKDSYNFKDYKDDDFIGIHIVLDTNDYHLTTPSLMAIYGQTSHCFVHGFENIKNALDDLNQVIVTFFSKGIYYYFDKSTPIFDLVQAHFIIDPGLNHDETSIINEYFSQNLEAPKEPFQNDLLGNNEWFEYAKKMAKHANSLYVQLDAELKQLKLESIFYEMDMPLQKILAKMEKNGITLNLPFYQNLEKDFNLELEEIQKTIEKFGGEGINIKSPKQVGFLLFEKLQLPIIKKTKTGYSTDSDVLTELEAMGVSEIPGLILKYRELEKLLSTYIRSFPKLIHTDQKIRTHFLQHVAETGRLSSENPNLQNIPIRTENGRKLRKGFVSEKNKILISADYSQVELRILAHFSKDPTMVKSFLENKDIHQQTASEIFEVPLEKVTKDQRSSAKAINFGLMYGQSSFGLSQQLKISQKEARDYITNYFTKFNSVKAYLDTLKESCEQTGYSITLFGRKRNIPDIKSSNRQIKSMAERMAINSPIQGTAADIIKKAMIEIDKTLTQNKFPAKILLQVHDELIFECEPQYEEELKKIIVDKMENVVQLIVPLKVDVGSGTNWYEI
jgi:DNA polymerase-1